MEEKELKEKKILVYLSIPEEKASYADIQKTLRTAILKLSAYLNEQPLPEGYDKWAPAIVNVLDENHKINPYDILSEPKKWRLFKLSIAALNIAKADIVWIPNGWGSDEYCSLEMQLLLQADGEVRMIFEDVFDRDHPDLVVSNKQPDTMEIAQTELLIGEEKGN